MSDVGETLAKEAKMASLPPLHLRKVIFELFGRTTFR